MINIHLWNDTLEVYVEEYEYRDSCYGKGAKFRRVKPFDTDIERFYTGNQFYNIPDHLLCL